MLVALQSDHKFNCHTVSLPTLFESHNINECRSLNDVNHVLQSSLFHHHHNNTDWEYIWISECCSSLQLSFTHLGGIQNHSLSTIHIMQYIYSQPFYLAVILAGKFIHNIVPSLPTMERKWSVAYPLLSANMKSVLWQIQIWNVNLNVISIIIHLHEIHGGNLQMGVQMCQIGRIKVPHKKRMGQGLMTSCCQRWAVCHWLPQWQQFCENRLERLSYNIPFEQRYCT